MQILQPQNTSTLLTPSPLLISPPQQTIFSLYLKALILGLISAQKINIGGEIYIGEIFAVIYLFLNFRNLKLSSAIRYLFFFGLLWSFCQFISDQINEISAKESIKGIAAPLVFTTSILGLSVFFSQRIRRMPSFLLGASLGTAINLLINPGDYFQSNPWKWGIGELVLTSTVIYFTFFLKNKRNIYLIFFLLTFSLFSLTQDSRSLAIFPVLSTAIYIATLNKITTPITRIIKGRLAATKATILLIATLMLANAIFTALFTTNFVLESLPEDSARKFKMQASGEYGIILGGRNELLISIEAFLDKPFFGHGSWAKDNSGYREKLATLSYMLGYAETDDLDTQHDLIPAHSYLMGALVWAGIAGGLFWLYTLRWLIAEFIRNIQHLGIYYHIGTTSIIWDIIFSPFGASSRWGSALFIAALYSYTNIINRQKIIK